SPASVCSAAASWGATAPQLVGIAPAHVGRATIWGRRGTAPAPRGIRRSQQCVEHARHRAPRPGYRAWHWRALRQSDAGWASSPAPYPTARGGRTSADGRGRRGTRTRRRTVPAGTDDARATRAIEAYPGVPRPAG